MPPQSLQPPLLTCCLYLNSASRFYSISLIYWVLPYESSCPEVSEYVCQRGVGSLENWYFETVHRSLWKRISTGSSESNLCQMILLWCQSRWGQNYSGLGSKCLSQSQCLKLCFHTRLQNANKLDDFQLKYFSVMMIWNKGDIASDFCLFTSLVIQGM